MAIAELMALVAPPAAPVEAGSPQGWAVIEEALRTVLPDDYKALVNRYGLGRFGGYAVPLNPFLRPPGYLHLVESGRAVLEDYEAGRAEFPEFHPPFPAFPAPGGLLPWGRDENAGLLCWRTLGPPEAWTVVLLDSHYSENCVAHPVSATGFLAGWLSGRLEVRFWPEDVGPQECPLFEPFTPPWYR